MAVVFSAVLFDHVAKPWPCSMRCFSGVDATKKGLRTLSCRASPKVGGVEFGAKVSGGCWFFWDWIMNVCQVMRSKHPQKYTKISKNRFSRGFHLGVRKVDKFHWLLGTGSPEAYEHIAPKRPEVRETGCLVKRETWRRLQSAGQLALEWCPHDVPFACCLSLTTRHCIAPHEATKKQRPTANSRSLYAILWYFMK